MYRGKYLDGRYQSLRRERPNNRAWRPPRNQQARSPKLHNADQRRRLAVKVCDTGISRCFKRYRPAPGGSAGSYMRLIYADVTYPNSAARFTVVEIRDQDGINLTRFVDKTKEYTSTAELQADLEAKLQTDRILVEITPDVAP